MDATRKDFLELSIAEMEDINGGMGLGIAAVTIAWWTFKILMITPTVCY